MEAAENDDRSKPGFVTLLSASASEALFHETLLQLRRAGPAALSRALACVSG